MAHAKKNIGTDSLKGNFIIAMPGLMDPNFSMTVTCICEHTSLGSVGLIINRLFSMVSGKDLFEELQLHDVSGADDIPVYFGGPVHSNEIFILHGPPFDWEGCFKVSSVLAMSNTMDLLEAISLGTGPRYYMIFMGCAGWGPGQLESEIRQNSWITCPAFDDIIFSTPISEKWKEAMKRVGIDPSFLSNTAGNA
ncbi:MAG: YqgE/AlgH family protein [Desulfobacterales bacterium]